MRTRRAHIGRRPLAGTTTAKQLHFDGDREILVLSHAASRLGVDHDAAVAECPVGTATNLLADKPVFDGDYVVAERLVVEDVAEAIVEGRVLIVAHLEQAVLDAECLADVVVETV